MMNLDIFSLPNEIIQKILEFLEVVVSVEMDRNIKAHWDDVVAQPGYLSTYRGANAGQKQIRERWKNELDEDMINFILEKCFFFKYNVTAVNIGHW